MESNGLPSFFQTGKGTTVLDSIDDRKGDTKNNSGIVGLSALEASLNASSSSSTKGVKYEDVNNNNSVESINLEVYEKMAHKQFKKIIKEANFKWNLIDTLIIHRYGKLQVNDKIVLVANFSSHRKDSFEACNFIMDYLKKDAPFWKNEFYDKKNEWLTNTN